MAITITKAHGFGLNVGHEEIDAKSIDFPVRRNLLGQKQLIDVYVESFSISSVKVSSNLVVDKQKLLRIKFVGGVAKEGYEIKDFHLTAYSNPYQILLNHDAIIDCDDLDSDNATIDFSIQLKVNGEVISRDYALTLNLIKAKPTCMVTFVPHEHLKYCHENVSVGFFEITNNCKYRYADLASVSLSLKYPQQFLEEIISFGLSSEITEDEPYYETSGLREQGESPVSILKVSYLSGRNVEIKRLIARNRISIPVYLDLEQLENPVEDIRYEKFFVVTKNILNDVADAPQECVVPVYRDITRTSLFVSCNKINVENNSKGKYGHFNWIKHQTGKKERFSGTQQIFELNIGNEATNPGVSPDSAVIVKEIKIVPSYNDSEIIANTEFLDTEEIENDFIILKNKVGSFVSFKCKLSHKCINDIPNNYAKISLSIDFDYIEDEAGLYNDEQLIWTHFHAIAIVDLEKDPGSEWLCVDYGTSATVAVFGDGTDHNVSLLRLNDRNKEIINERENERFRTPRFENGDYFLSSNIMLQSNTPSLDAMTCENSLIYLSPSEPVFHSEKGKFRLPYMKALAGYKSLPNSEKYSQFTYKIHETDNDTVCFEDEPLEVDKIFKATYRSLFKDYISECIPQGKVINKIVLSVPNTYTPHHIEFIRNVVKAEVPSLRSDYIWFVSESDAIAYYYIRNWRTFNENRDEEYEGQTEHILVYDMGAGTLDVTYLTIEHLTTGDKKVSLSSKMGLNKAGNYLDYVLASALVDLYPKFNEAMLNPSPDPTMQNQLGKLKFFIKNELKPKLFSQDSITFSAWNGQSFMGIDFEDEELDLRLIRSSQKVQDFVTECTNKLFDRFMQINNLNMDESPIDTLIMTGRSIQFGNIKQQLQQRINSWNDDSHCRALEIHGDQLKTIVSQGALYYAALYGKRTSSVILNNRNLYAGYGVLYIDRKNKWCYQPLLDSKTRSTNRTISSTGQINGMQIFTYDTDRYSADDTVKDIILDMRNTIEAYLVQCYSINPVTDYMDEERRNDYISIMVPFNPESVSDDIKKVHVRLEVNEKNEMIFTAGNMTFETSAPVKIDVETNNTFKHSMWPYA